MRFFGQETPDKPTPLDEETAKLRARLILEEDLETIVKGLGLEVVFSTPSGNVAINRDNIADIIGAKVITFNKVDEVNMEELADGLADSAYVGAYGTAVAAGIDLEPIEDVVHECNMTKAWREEDLAKARELSPTATVENYGNGLYRLVREDGKIIKSPNFVAPDEAIRAELNRQSQR